MKTLGIVSFILLISTALAQLFSPSLHRTGGTSASAGYHSVYDTSVVYDEKENKVIEWYFNLTFLKKKNEYLHPI